MSYLAQVLDAKEPKFSLYIDDLMKLRNLSGTDSRLVGALSKKAAGVFVELGLDIGDTKVSELKRSLENRAKIDGKVLVGDVSVLKGAKKVNWKNVYAQPSIKGIDERVVNLNRLFKDFVKKNSSLKFWADNLWTGIIVDGQVVSANIFDILSKNEDLAFMRQSLLSELAERFNK